jgi:hypothetical protein
MDRKGMCQAGRGEVSGVVLRETQLTYQDHQIESESIPGQGKRIGRRTPIAPGLCGTCSIGTAISPMNQPYRPIKSNDGSLRKSRVASQGRLASQTDGHLWTKIASRHGCVLSRLLPVAHDFLPQGISSVSILLRVYHFCQDAIIAPTVKKLREPGQTTSPKAGRGFR